MGYTLFLCTVIVNEWYTYTKNYLKYLYLTEYSFYFCLESTAKLKTPLKPLRNF